MKKLLIGILVISCSMLLSNCNNQPPKEFCIKFTGVPHTGFPFAKDEILKLSMKKLNNYTMTNSEGKPVGTLRPLYGWIGPGGTTTCIGEWKLRTGETGTFTVDDDYEVMTFAPDGDYGAGYFEYVECP